MYYLICYRLHRIGQNYEGLYSAIRGLSNTWHNTTSAWIVSSFLSAGGIYNRLKAHIDGNDELTVFKLAGPYFGQLNPDDIRWLSVQPGLRAEV